VLRLRKPGRRTAQIQTARRPGQNQEASLGRRMTGWRSGAVLPCKAVTVSDPAWTSATRIAAVRGGELVQLITRPCLA